MTALNTVFSKDKRQVTFRVNTLLSCQKEIEKVLTAAHINYTKLDIPKNCFLLENGFSEPDLWKLDIYKEGKIYIQGISSQIPVHYFQRPVSSERGFNRLRILDACAAPGWKTSQLGALYQDAEIYAFEPQKIRFEKMLHNIKKLWVKNVQSFHDSVENISKYISETEYFDMILVDAPCSWEGAIHFSDSTFLENWSITHIRKNYARQKAICDSVLPYLKSGWEIIYSTCTISPEENEAVVHYLLCKYSELHLENIDFQDNKYINTKRALKNFEKYSFKKEISENSIRVIPGEFSEWFYMAKLRKNGISNSYWSN